MNREGLLWNMKLVFHLYYYEDENIFIDDGGFIVYDLFSIVTPQDLFLFRKDHRFNCFPMVGIPEVMCKILTVLKSYDIYDLDIGDDYERNERYEKAKQREYRT
jgi:hypothetical protein